MINAVKRLRRESNRGNGCCLADSDPISSVTLPDLKPHALRGAFCRIWWGHSFIRSAFFAIIRAFLVLLGSTSAFEGTKSQWRYG